MFEPLTHFYVLGKPKAQPRARVARSGHFYTPPTGREWRQKVEEAARHEWTGKLPLEGPVFIDMVFLMPGGVEGEPCPKKPDRDNLEKAVLDALTRAGVWKDDAQVCDGSTKKYYNGDKPAGVLIQIAKWV